MANKKPLVCVDARMLEHSGIGMIIKNVLPHILDDFSWHLLVNQESFQKNSWAHHLPYTEVSTPIYTLKEQLKLGSMIPAGAALTWFPHYNVPLVLPKRLNYVVNINDCFHRAYYNTLSLAQKVYATWVMGQAAARASKIITISKFSEQQILQFTGCAKEKVITMLLAADNQHFGQAYSAAAVSEVRAKYNLPQNYLLYVGNLKPHKNLISLLEAFARLKSKPQHTELKLVLCGNFKGFITGIDDLDTRVQQLGLQGQVIKPGFVLDEHLPCIYQQSAGFVFPSYYEGFGLPVLEAMAAGIPVLSSNAASLPEVGGDAVLYCAPDNVGEMAQQLEVLVGNHAIRTSLISKGYEQVQQFSWQKTAQGYADVFRQQLKA